MQLWFCPVSADSNRRDLLFVRRRGSPILWSILTIPVIIVIYLLVLAFPEPLFAHSLCAHNFTFYSNSPIDPGILPLTDEVNAKLQRSEIFDRSVHFRVFIVGNKHLYTFFNGPYRSAIARNYEIGNAIFIPMLDVKRSRIIHFGGRHAGAANILAHEAVHTLKRTGWAEKSRSFATLHSPSTSAQGHIA